MIVEPAWRLDEALSNKRVSVVPPANGRTKLAIATENALLEGCDEGHTCFPRISESEGLKSLGVLEP
ncbi:hypothetical protein JTE90_013676 [Oedothorax gibbosus]|uniref:Uncharacterized protein n=1 Tax=Oedothorax gibbosus TaxID=931172 RepID=A0AAV6VD93_9ARAC|nr:hypothetical protein JTE90_013676 [Oedothorax gibbosus]